MLRINRCSSQGRRFSLQNYQKHGQHLKIPKRFYEIDLQPSRRIAEPSLLETYSIYENPSVLLSKLPEAHSTADLHALLTLYYRTFSYHELLETLQNIPTERWDIRCYLFEIAASYHLKDYQYVLTIYNELLKKYPRTCSVHEEIVGWMIMTYGKMKRPNLLSTTWERSELDESELAPYLIKGFGSLDINKSIEIFERQVKRSFGADDQEKNLILFDAMLTALAESMGVNDELQKDLELSPNLDLERVDFMLELFKRLQGYCNQVNTSQGLPTPPEKKLLYLTPASHTIAILLKTLVLAPTPPPKTPFHSANNPYLSTALSIYEWAEANTPKNSLVELQGARILWKLDQAKAQLKVYHMQQDKMEVAELGSLMKAYRKAYKEAQKYQSK